MAAQVPVRVIDLAEARRTVLVRQPLGDDPSAEAVVDAILADVRARSDAALRDLTERFDGVRIERFEVDRAAIRAAHAAVDDDVVEAMRLAADQLRTFHERHRARSWLEFAEGGAMGQIVNPIERVGLLAPGGRAAYPSTVLHTAVPALVAGCREVVICSPPRYNGGVHPAILIAADIAGVERVFAIGGAQAVAALAYGTEQVPAVEKVVGPGNQYVAAAKRKVFGRVGIDQIAGPTETVLIVDESADPDAVAADALAQAEHDPLASAIVLATTAAVASAVARAIDRQLLTFARAEIARQSFADRGAVVFAGSLDVALVAANAYAPEHLCLAIADPWSALSLVKNAGGVFVGERSLEAIGDYTAGPSHVMPTGGTARFSSPLTVNDFVKITSVFGLSREAVERLGPPAAALARAEGLPGHAAAIEHRLKGAVRA